MTDSTEQASTRWAQLSGGASGADYAARIAALAASGQDMHGEANFCARLVEPPARILDAGCGTGRVAIRLSELGYRCTGADLDDSMLAQARIARPDLRWLTADLAQLEPADPFDLVVAAGNVIPLLAPGTLLPTLRNLTGAVNPTGVLVTGFGLDRAQLPKGCPVTTLADYDAAATLAGLRLIARYASWDSEPLDPTSGYAVSVHAPVSPA
ncbi:MAG: class I SAM-dependent methyltransferase [Actinomycetota bacterium]|nr:class I SAM-dependent methyltransferase [Actinomycetota bacterium]